MRSGSSCDADSQRDNTGHRRPVATEPAGGGGAAVESQLAGGQARRRGRSSTIIAVVLPSSTTNNNVISMRPRRSARHGTALHGQLQRIDDVRVMRWRRGRRHRRRRRRRSRWKWNTTRNARFDNKCSRAGPGCAGRGRVAICTLRQIC